MSQSSGCFSYLFLPTSSPSIGIKTQVEESEIKNHSKHFFPLLHCNQYLRPLETPGEEEYLVRKFFQIHITKPLANKAHTIKWNSENEDTTDLT